MVMTGMPASTRFLTYGACAALLFDCTITRSYCLVMQSSSSPFSVLSSPSPLTQVSSMLSYCSAAFFISFVIHAAKVSALARATKQTLFFSAEAAPVSPPAAEEALSAATEPPAGALPAALGAELPQAAMDSTRTELNIAVQIFFSFIFFTFLLLNGFIVHARLCQRSGCFLWFFDNDLL